MTIHLGPGEAYFRPQPTCPTHGQMHYEWDPAAVCPCDHQQAGCYRWVCHGYDGEGCGHSVADDDVEWEHLGRVGPAEFTFTPMPSGDR